MEYFWIVGRPSNSSNWFSSKPAALHFIVVSLFGSTHIVEAPTTAE